MGFIEKLEIFGEATIIMLTILMNIVQIDYVPLNIWMNTLHLRYNSLPKKSWEFFKEHAPVCETQSRQKIGK